MRYPMGIKKILPYIGAIVAVIAAMITVYIASSKHTDTPESWNAMAASVQQVGEAADQAASVAVEQKDYAVCVASEGTSVLASAVKESLTAAGQGTCRLPSAEGDITPCLWDLTTEAPAAEVTEAPAAEAPAAETAEVVSRVAAGVDVPAVVEIAIGPLVALVKGMIENSDASDKVKAWGTGVLTWLDSARPSIIALIENPQSGKLTVEGVDIAGCNP